MSLGDLTSVSQQNTRISAVDQNNAKLCKVRADYEAKLQAMQREAQKYMQLLDDERRANKETIAQYVKAKALLQEGDERIRNLGEEIKKRDQTICLMKL